MGMFDYIRCEMPLPDGSDGHRELQTKDTPDQYLTTYTITANGRLTWRPYEMEEVPLAERPYPDAPEGDIRRLIGCMRRSEREPEVIDFHGDIYFYDAKADYRARFTEGVCTSIVSLPTEPQS